MFDEENLNKSVPINGTCLYFALADENAKGTTEEDLYKKEYDEWGYVKIDDEGNKNQVFIKKNYYYFPVVAFNIKFE